MSFDGSATASWHRCDGCMAEAPHVPRCEPSQLRSGLAIGEAREAARDAGWALGKWNPAIGKEQDFCPVCARKRGHA